MAQSIRAGRELLSMGWTLCERGANAGAGARVHARVTALPQMPPISGADGRLAYANSEPLESRRRLAGKRRSTLVSQTFGQPFMQYRLRSPTEMTEARPTSNSSGVDRHGL